MIEVKKRFDPLNLLNPGKVRDPARIGREAAAAFDAGLEHAAREARQLVRHAALARR
jgi:hypothetical protein